MLADRRLPAKAPPAPRTPNTIPERTLTRPACRWTAVPATAVTPTMLYQQLRLITITPFP